MTSRNIPKGWHIFRGEHPIPPAPPWRRFGGRREDPATGDKEKRARFIFEDTEIDLINAALYLRRPLLVTGKPGVGKSTLIHDVARELQLGKVLTWAINTRSTLEQGQYRYDAIGRLQELEASKVSKHERRDDAAPPERTEEDEARDALGRFITLGPLGTAFLPGQRPRALLIDEIDKSDIDLPNDLLNLFEEGSYEVPVLVRAREKWKRVPVGTSDDEEVVIEKGKVQATEFPFVVMTSNGERDFPQPFLRRCIRMQMNPPTPGKLEDIVRQHLPEVSRGAAKKLITDFYNRTQSGVDLATDQLLNAVLLTTKYSIDLSTEKDPLIEHIFRDLKL